ncbi:MAG TPA: autoinducer 2 ABC transporter substrate-binding protein [Chthonomonadaceae bacterium]|nr:autoinducer 2 ABC transporter substrate-binding protein [Chthonomonadaceae bacterium]
MRTTISKRQTRGGVLPLAALAALTCVLVAGCEKEQTPSPPAAPPPGTSAAGGTAPAAGAKKKIVFVFKVGGLSYSEACKAGAQQANDDPALNATVQYLAPAPGPAAAAAQKDIVEQAIVGHPDAIVVSPNDSQAIKPALQKAKDAGVRVFTWDSDAPDSPREFYVAAVDDVQIGADIAKALAKSIDDKGAVLLFSGGKTAENLNKHLEGITGELRKHPNIKIADTVYNDDNTDKAKSMALAALQAHPEAVGIAATNSPSPRGAAEALQTLHKVGKVKVWGLGLPSENKAYLEAGSVTGLYLWDPQNLTYDTAKLVRAALDGKPPKDGDKMDDGAIQVRGALVTLPLRLEITKENVESLKF